VIIKIPIICSKARAQILSSAHNPQNIQISTFIFFTSIEQVDSDSKKKKVKLSL
jgi:hypothetical protein